MGREAFWDLDAPVQRVGAAATPPPYAPELNPVEYLWAWLKRHALANFCPANMNVLHRTARNKLRSAQRRTTIIVACWKQASLF